MKSKPGKEFLDSMAKNPANWRGIFYSNRNDPRLIVPKLSPSLGWTFNFGNIYSYITFLGILLLVIAFSYL